MVEKTLNPINAQANYDFAVAAANAALLRRQALDETRFPHIESSKPSPPPAPKSTATSTSSSPRPKKVRPRAPLGSTAPSGPVIKPNQKVVPIYPINPNIKGIWGTMREMLSERGVFAFVQGFAPTLFRQVTFSTVQFTTYNFLRQLIHPQSEEPIPVYKSLGAGLLSSVAVVVATQPIDLIKTRMQTSNARSVYQSTPRAAYTIFVQEGFTTFWVGSFPRFIKVTAGSALTFGIYEVVVDMLKVVVKEKPFSSS